MRTAITTLLSVLLFACGNVTQFEAPIQELAALWESAQGKLSAVVDETSRSQQVVQQVMEKMTEAEASAAAAGDEYQTKLKTLQQAMQSQSAQLGQLAQQTSEFLTEWQAGTTELDGLKAGLAAGKLPGSAETAIENLNALAAKANDNSTTWTQRVQAINAELDIAIESFGSLAASF
jgi:chromosome segregation ATPase